MHRAAGNGDWLHLMSKKDCGRSSPKQYYTHVEKAQKVICVVSIEDGANRTMNSLEPEGRL